MGPLERNCVKNTFESKREALRIYQTEKSYPNSSSFSIHSSRIHGQIGVNNSTHSRTHVILFIMASLKNEISKYISK